MKRPPGNTLDTPRPQADPHFDLDKPSPVVPGQTTPPSAPVIQPRYNLDLDRVTPPPVLAVPPTRKTGFAWASFWWLWLAIALVILALILVGYFWLNPAKTEPSNTPAVTVVTIGSNAQMQPQSDFKLTFGVSGPVSEVLVKAGDNVKKDQPLARLDASELQNSLKAAQANLTSAQNELAQLKAGADENQIKIAQAQLDQAKARVDQLRSPKGTPAEIESARAGLNEAKATLEQLRQGGNPATKAQAQAAVSDAQAKLTAAQAKLEKLQAAPATPDTSAAQAKVNQAKNSLENVRVKFYTQVAQAQIDRDQGLIALSKADDKYKTLYSQLHYQNGTVKPGVTQTELEQELEVYSQYQDALAKFNKLESTLNDLRTAQYNELRAAEITVAEANTALALAKAAPTKADINDAQVAVAQSQANLDKARAALANTTPTDADIATAQAQVSSAEATLAWLSAGASQNELKQAEADVNAKDAALQELLKDPDNNALAIKQAQVELRQGELARLQTQLSYTTLKAPADGMVATLNMVAGQFVGSGTEVAQLVELSKTELHLSLSEAVGKKLVQNQALTVNFPNVPARSFTGKVTYISPRTQLNSGPGYLVTVTLDEVAG